MTRIVSPFVGVVASLLTLHAAHAQPTLPPRAHAENIVDTHHGVRVPDPYRYLENVGSEDTQAWARMQAAHAQAVLARVQGRDELRQRIGALADASGDEVRDILRMPGERIYYLKRGAGDQQFKLMRRTGLDGEERVILDPVSGANPGANPGANSSADTGVNTRGSAITYFRPSWDGRYLAFGVAQGGSEDASLEVLEIDSGKRIGQPIPRVTGSRLHWAPDSRRLSYTQRRELAAETPDTEFFLDATVHLLDLRRGTPRSKPIFGRAVNPALRLERLDFGEVIFSPDSRFMVARTTDTTSPEGRLFVAAVTALDRSGAIPWRAISTANDKIVEVQLRGERLYFLTRARSPKAEVMALDLRQPVLARATRVAGAPEGGGAIEHFVVGREAVLTEVREPFRRGLWQHALGAGNRVGNSAGKSAGKGARKGSDNVADNRAPREGQAREITAGMDGSFGLASEPMRAGGDVLVTVSSWTRATLAAAIDAQGAIRETTLTRTTPITGAPELEARVALVPSHDGARVPVAVVHRKGLPLDGRRPDDPGRRWRLRAVDGCALRCDGDRVVRTRRRAGLRRRARRRRLRRHLASRRLQDDQAQHLERRHCGRALVDRTPIRLAEDAGHLGHQCRRHLRRACHDSDARTLRRRDLRRCRTRRRARGVVGQRHHQHVRVRQRE